MDRRMMDNPSLADVDWAFDQYEAVRDALPSARFPAAAERIDSTALLVERFDTVLLDAFGVLNIGDTPIPGAAAFITDLRAAGRQVRIVSNSASIPTDVSYEKFKRFGFDFTRDEIITSRDALKVALGTARGQTWGVMAVSASQIDELGVPCLPLEDDPAAFEQADGFILLASGTWTAARQARLIEAMRARPRPVLVGNPDIVAPQEVGLTIEPGAYAHDLARETGCTPEFYGKPFGNIYELALASLGDIDRSRTLMVGDTLHTDVLGGAAFGVKTMLIGDYGLFAGRDAAGFITRSGITPDVLLSGY